MHFKYLKDYSNSHSYQYGSPHILTSTGVTNILSWTNVLVFYFLLRAFDAWFQKRQCMPHSENTNFPHHERSLWSLGETSILSYLTSTHPKHSIALNSQYWLQANVAPLAKEILQFKQPSSQNAVPEKWPGTLVSEPFGGSHFIPLVNTQNTYAHNQAI